MKILLSIFLLICLSGCTQRKKIPKDVLPQNQMRHIMWDLIRADEFAGNFVSRDSSLNRKAESVKLYEQVFRIHATTREQFEQSLNFYKSRPDLLKTVMDSLRSNERKAMRELSSPPSYPDTANPRQRVKKPVSN
jgi:hypothetical protein